jgi:hypothetical protein
MLARRGHGMLEIRRSGTYRHLDGIVRMSLWLFCRWSPGFTVALHCCQIRKSKVRMRDVREPNSPRLKCMSRARAHARLQVDLGDMW